MAKSKRLLQKSNNSTIEIFSRAAETCKKNYGHYPNIIGIGVGLKLKNGHPVNEQLCIHFYVQRKLKRISSNKKLPRFVYARTNDGKVNYTLKLCTDVIELRNLRFACKSGTEIGVIGESGTITMLFQNKIQDKSDFYLITCAHVAGNLQQSPPVDPKISSSCCKKSAVLATTIVNSTAPQGIVDYDVALAKLTPECTPLPELQVVGSSTPLLRFLPSDDIRPGMTLNCAFPRSNVLTANVLSYRTSLPLPYDNREYQVNNLFIINKTPIKGDSGGLLYDGADAVGILVGKSGTGFGLFQPLIEAFDYIREISPFPIKCFKEVN